MMFGPSQAFPCALLGPRAPWLKRIFSQVQWIHCQQNTHTLQRRSVAERKHVAHLIKRPSKTSGCESAPFNFRAVQDTRTLKPVAGLFPFGPGVVYVIFRNRRLVAPPLATRRPTGAGLGLAIQDDHPRVSAMREHPGGGPEIHFQGGKEGLVSNPSAPDRSVCSRLLDRSSVLQWFFGRVSNICGNKSP